MKKIIVITILFFLTNPGWGSEQVFQKLEETYRQGKITLDEIILNKVYYLV